VITAITLFDDKRGTSYPVKPAAGIAFQGMEVTASPRTAENDLALADGTDDETAFLGSAAVTMDLTVLHPGTRAVLDALASYLVPSARPRLVVSDDEWVTDRQLVLRFDSHAHPITIQKGRIREVQLAWKAPRGCWEDTGIQQWTIGADVPDVTGFPLIAGPGGNWLAGANSGSAQNAGFEGGIGTWTGAGNGTPTATAAQAHSGTGALLLTSVAAGDMTAAHCQAANIASQGMPCQAGDSVPVGTWSRAVVSPRTFKAGAQFYDAAGVVISTLYAATPPVNSTTAWTQHTGSVTAPAGAANCRKVSTAVATAAAAEQHYFDDESLQPGSAGVQVNDALGFRFPASTAQADMLITASGTLRPRWTARLYGPAVGPKLTRDDTGQTFDFTDALVLGPGQYVELDFRAQTARLLSDPNQSVMGLVNFASYDWFPLDPGQAARMRYHATSGTAPGSVALITAYPVWMP